MTLFIKLAKYSLAGLVNTLISYIVIFGCMAVGVQATLSNALGFLIGLLTSYLQSRYWVFRSRNRVLGESLKFLLCFIIAFGVNMGVLQLLLNYKLEPYIAQIFACATYALTSFVLNSTYVFTKGVRGA